MWKKAVNTVNISSNKKSNESDEYRYTYALSYIAIVKGHYNKDLKSILNDKLSSEYPELKGHAIGTFYDTKHNESHIRVSIDSTTKLDQSILTVINDTVKIYEDVVSTDMFILPHKVPIYG